MLTLRQIEVIRAIMVTGTVGGAARLLNVSSPGISRVMKHAESTLSLKLFSRRHGRYAPSPEARDNWPGLVALPIVEPTDFETYIAFRRDTILSGYCDRFIGLLRREMEALRKATRRQKIT